MQQETSTSLIQRGAGSARRHPALRLLGGTVLGLFCLILVLLIAWGTAAIWFDGPASRPLAAALAAGFALICMAVLVLLRPFWWAVLAVLAGWAALVAWWLTIPPTNTADWQSDVARPAVAEINGDQVTLHNVRNFDYRSETDYTAHWEDRSFNLNDVEGVDIFFSFWGPTLIAHTIMSFDFADGQHIAFSIETRKKEGQSYSTVLGFFRQYELYYVVADERDVIRLRTNYRGEHVFLYRLRAKPPLARALLVSYLNKVNALARQPQWYNAWSHNCTTSIRLQVEAAGQKNPWNWRYMANGKGPELLYARHSINTSMPFAELRERSEINEAAKAAGSAPDFSARIRADLPPRPQ